MRFLLLASVFAAMPACGGDDGGFVDDRPISLGGSCSDTDRAGRFRLEVIIEGGGAGSFLSGEALDRADPALARQLDAEEGPCRLLRRLNPLCDPACDADSVCSIDSVCVPRARGTDIGAVRVGGLAADIEMSARPPGNNYFDTEIAHPAVSGGEEIRLRAGDTDLALDGLGTEPLVVTGGDLAIARTEPLAITWEPPTAAGTSSEVALTLNIDQHGQTPVTLRCDFADTGSSEVSATIIDALFAAGVSGFPNVVVERRTADSQETNAGCVDFQVAHPRRVNASVAGHTPCNGPMDCPLGQTCDLGSNTCIDE